VKIIGQCYTKREKGNHFKRKNRLKQAVFACFGASRRSAEFKVKVYIFLPFTNAKNMVIIYTMVHWKIRAGRRENDSSPLKAAV